MGTTKSRKNVFAQVFSVFKSKRFRNFFYLALIVFASFSMLCIDKDNAIRRNYFSFLNNNFIANLITWLGIERYDVTSSAWVLFVIIMTVATIIVLGNIIAPTIVDKKVKNNPNLFSTEKKTRAWYTVLFYGVLVLIAAAIIGIAALLGVFKFYNTNSTESSPFISLLTMLAFFVAFTVALFIVIAIILFIVRLIVLACTGKLNKSEEPEVVPVTEPVEEPVAEIVEETAATAETEPAKEEPAAETVEVTEPTESVQEEPEVAPVVTQKEPVIIIDTASEKIEVKHEESQVKPVTRKSVQKSFEGKMAQATKEQKAYYNELKNYMLSFKRVNSRLSWNFDSFNIGRKKVVKIAFRGKTIVAYLALDPKDYANTKYYPHDMSSKRKFADTPMMIKIKSERGVKFATELMAKVCEGLDVKKNFVEKKYSFPYMSNKKLVENGLAKEITITVFAPKK